MTKSEQHTEIARAGFLAILLANRKVLQPEVLTRLRESVEQPKQLPLEDAE